MSKKKDDLILFAPGLDEDLRLTHAAGKFMATDDHGSQLYPHAHHVMGHHRHHRRHRKRSSKQGSGSESREGGHASDSEEESRYTIFLMGIGRGEPLQFLDI